MSAPKAYVHSIGQHGANHLPEVRIRFVGTRAEQEAACREWADVYASGVRGLDVIMSAPELLEALREMLYRFAPLEESNTPNRCAIERARAAIAKAGGK